MVLSGHGGEDIEDKGNANEDYEDGEDAPHAGRHRDAGAIGTGTDGPMDCFDHERRDGSSGTGKGTGTE